MRSLSGTISPADAKAFFSISSDIRDGLPKAKSKQMPYRGLVGEIRKTLNFWISRR